MRPVVYERCAKRSAPFCAKRRQISSPSSSRMFAAHLCAALDTRPRRGRLRRAEQHERRIERDRRERIAGHADRFVTVDRGDDRDTRRVVADDRPNRRGVGGKDLFAGRAHAAPGRAGARIDLEPLVARGDLGGPDARRGLGRALLDGVELVVAMGGIVVEQHEPAGAGFAGDVDGVLGRAVPPVPLRLRTPRSCAGRRGSRCRRRRTAPAPGRGCSRRCASGCSPDRGRGGTRPRRPPMSTRNPSVGPMWRTHRRRAPSPLRWRSRRRRCRGTARRRSSWLGHDREERRPHHLCEHLTEGSGLLAGSVDVERRPLAVQRGEERQPLHVIPVQVRQAAPIRGTPPCNAERRDAARCRDRAGSEARRRSRARRTTNGRRSARTSGPAHGVEPRTPLNTTRIPPDIVGRIATLCGTLNSRPRPGRRRVPTGPSRTLGASEGARRWRSTRERTNTHLGTDGDVIVTEGLTKVFDGRGGAAARGREPRPCGSTGARSSGCSARTAPGRRPPSAC